MIKVILFDFDDTLIRTYSSAVNHIRNAAKLFGVRVPHESEIKLHWGKHFKDFTTSLWPGLNTGGFNEIYEKFLTRMRGYPPVDGVHEVIETLTGNYMLGLVTSRDSMSLPIRARQANIDLGSFAHIVTSDDVRHYKPDPRVFDEILRKTEIDGIKKEEIVYIGDNIVDFHAARNAGLNFFGVTTGVVTKEDFLKEGLREERILISVTELPEKLKRF